jgi:hypothetical protein
MRITLPSLYSPVITSHRTHAGQVKRINARAKNSAIHNRTEVLHICGNAVPPYNCYRFRGTASAVRVPRFFCYVSPRSSYQEGKAGYRIVMVEIDKEFCGPCVKTKDLKGLPHMQPGIQTDRDYAVWRQPLLNLSICF